MFEWINDHPYTCPILMTLQSWLFWQEWRYGSDGWIVMRAPNSRDTCWFPKWMILAECRFWNSRIGMKIRCFAGSQQREYRLKRQDEIDRYRNEDCIREKVRLAMFKIQSAKG